MKNTNPFCIAQSTGIPQPLIEAFGCKKIATKKQLPKFLARGTIDLLDNGNISKIIILAQISIIKKSYHAQQKKQ